MIRCLLDIVNYADAVSPLLAKIKLPQSAYKHNLCHSPFTNNAQDLMNLPKEALENTGKKHKMLVTSHFLPWLLFFHIRELNPYSIDTHFNASTTDRF